MPIHMLVTIFPYEVKAVLGLFYLESNTISWSGYVESTTGQDNIL